MPNLIAKISNRRQVNKSTLCIVTCPACSGSYSLTYGGWSAIVCPACKSTLYRNRASFRASEVTQ